MKIIFQTVNFDRPGIAAEHDDNFRIVFEAIKQLLTEEEKPKRKIGF